MNKRLLISFAAIMGAMTSFAYNEGDYVYTHDAKFKVVGANMQTELLAQTIGQLKLVLLRMVAMLSRVLMLQPILQATICIRLFLSSRVRLMLLHLR